LVLDELQHGEELEAMYRGAKCIHEALDNVGEDDEAYEDQDSEEEAEE
jgi:hypothetical protein